ncbi:MAG TPA: ribonuclease III [Candidatus Scybalousia intestinigallinarum]|nr:ribonuclease III [Candidatus Scybalousia intestinigallinarum]
MRLDSLLGIIKTVIEVKAVEINPLVLAYLGDTIYENYVRRFLIASYGGNVKQLQEKSIEYVSARSQAMYLKRLLELDFFTEEEMYILKRARNYKSKSHPKNCDVVTYKHATALEAVIGYLDLIGRNTRIQEIMDMILGGKLC